DEDRIDRIDRLRPADPRVGFLDQTLAQPPPVVLAAAARGRLHVDLLARVLSDIADVQVPGLAVEARAPRIAQAVGPDLAVPAARAKRVGGGNRVVPLRVEREVVAANVDAQDLPQQGGEVLSIADARRVARSVV